jgi:hypothetical protein
MVSGAFAAAFFLLDLSVEAAVRKTAAAATASANQERFSNALTVAKTAVANETSKSVTKTRRMTRKFLSIFFVMINIFCKNP